MEHFRWTYKWRNNGQRCCNSNQLSSEIQFDSIFSFLFIEKKSKATTNHLRIFNWNAFQTTEFGAFNNFALPAGFMPVVWTQDRVTVPPETAEVFRLLFLIFIDIIGVFFCLKNIKNIGISFWTFSFEHNASRLSYFRSTLVHLLYRRCGICSLSRSTSWWSIQWNGRRFDFYFGFFFASWD